MPSKQPSNAAPPAGKVLPLHSASAGDAPPTSVRSSYTKQRKTQDSDHPPSRGIPRQKKGSPKPRKKGPFNQQSSLHPTEIGPHRLAAAPRDIDITV